MKSLFGEGDWIAVPLLATGFGVGLIARKGRSGVVLGYFFGPRCERIPDLGLLSGLTSNRAILIRRFRDTGLQNGHWSVIGKLPGWDRQAWPIPKFEASESDPRPNKCWVSVYGDDLSVVGHEYVPRSQAEGLSKDILSAHFSLQITLTQLLDHEGYLLLRKGV